MSILIETWALDHLQRYDEAERLVDLFYSGLEAAANDEYRARFAMHRLRFRSLQGDFAIAAMAYQEADRWSEALPSERRVHLHLDGSYLFQQAGEYTMALSSARKAEALAGADPALLAFARLLKNESLLKIELGRTPERIAGAIGELRQVVEDLSRYEAWQRLTAALATLSEAYLMVGDQARADSSYTASLQIATEHNNPRGTIFAHLRWGREHMKQERYDQAQAALLRALVVSDSADVLEYRLFLQYSLGQVYEALRDYEQARSYYRTVATSPPSTPPTYREVYARSQAQVRLVMMQENASLKVYLITLALLFTLSLLLNAYLLYKLRQRRLNHQPVSTRITSEHHNTSPLDAIVAELGLDGDRFVKSRRYVECIHHIRSNPEALHNEITHLAALDRLDRLERDLGKPQDLFACVEAWMTEHADATFNEKPGNAVGSTLRKAFTKLDTPWPQSLQEWDALMQIKR